MKTLLLTFLALTAGVLPALAASPDFKVELFSHRIVNALTLEAREQSVTLCGAKTDGPCLVLPPATKISCFTHHFVQCRYGTTDRNFTFLTIDSGASFRIAPTFSKMTEPPEEFLTRNVHVNLSSGNLHVMTRVDLESYVAGVLRGEASVLQAPAARQAMAILARTWALRWQGRHRAEGFDYCSLTHCQVFRLAQGGKGNAADVPDPAVAATRGQVLKYHGALADPYFTACCGGMTEAAGNVWPDCAQPYLIPVHDPYCLASRHAAWTQSLTAETLEQILREDLHLPMKLPLAELTVEQRDGSGRALVLRATAGSVWNIDANQFRYALDRRRGWGQIKSNLYSIEHKGNSWVFSGHGLGHGVGLCQAGAEQMAMMGFSAEKILGTYFPGTQIALHSSDDADPVASSEHFQLIYLSSQEPWVQQTLDTLEQWRKELGAHAEILPPRLRVETWGAVADFIRATGEPGWAAAASDGQSIALQPIDLLARKGILNQTLRHELTHLVVHRLRAKGVPGWFEEGCVLYLTGERIEAPVATSKTTRELEAAIARPRSEAEMKIAYAQALERVRKFAGREGDAALWRVLEHPTADDLRRLQ